MADNNSEDTLDDRIQRVRAMVINKSITEGIVTSERELDALSARLLKQHHREAGEPGRTVSDLPEASVTVDDFTNRISAKTTVHQVTKSLYTICCNLGFRQLRIYLYDKYLKRLFGIDAMGNSERVIVELRQGTIEKYRCQIDEQKSHSFRCLSLDEPVIVRSFSGGNDDGLFEIRNAEGVCEIQGVEECEFLDHKGERTHVDFPFTDELGKVSVDFGGREVADDLSKRIELLEPYVRAVGEHISFLYFRTVQEPVLRARTLITGCHSLLKLADAVVGQETAKLLSCDELQLFRVTTDQRASISVSRLATTNATNSPVVLAEDDPVRTTAATGIATCFDFAQGGLCTEAAATREGYHESLKRLVSELGGNGAAFFIPVMNHCGAVLAVLGAYSRKPGAIESHSSVRVTLQRFATECVAPEIERIHTEHISRGYPELWTKISRFSMTDSNAFFRFLTELRAIFDAFPGSEHVAVCMLGLKCAEGDVRYFRVAGTEKDDFFRTRVAKAGCSLTKWLSGQNQDLTLIRDFTERDRFEETADLPMEGNAGLLAAAIDLPVNQGTIEFGELIVLCDPDAVVLSEYGRLLRYVAERVAENLAKRELHARYLEGVRDEMCQYRRRLKREVTRIIRHLGSIIDDDNEQCDRRQLVKTVNQVLNSGLFLDAAKIERLALHEASKMVRPYLNNQTETCLLRDVVAEAAASSQEGIAVQNLIGQEVKVSAPKGTLMCLLFKVLNGFQRISGSKEIAANCRFVDDDSKTVELVFESLDDVNQPVDIAAYFDSDPFVSVNPECDQYEAVKQLACSTATSLTDAMYSDYPGGVRLRTESSGKPKLIISIPTAYASSV